MNDNYETPEMEVYAAGADALSTSNMDQTETQPWG